MTDIVSSTLMLQNFFKLDDRASYKDFDSAEALEQHFENANSLSNAILKDVEIHRLKFKNKKFENVRFSHVPFREVTFTECIFEDCLFVGTSFDTCEFHRCRFYNCNTYKFVLKNTYLDPLSFSLDRRYRKTASNVGVELYQKLFDNAQQMHQSLFAASADVERRRWRRYQWKYDFKEARNSRGLLIFSIISDWVYDFFAKYGYGPLRFLAWSVGFFLFLSMLVQSYWASMEITKGGARVEAASFVDAAYYTLLILSSLGFSDFMPASATGKFLVLVLAFLGVSWVGLFTAILVRRLIR